MPDARNALTAPAARPPLSAGQLADYTRFLADEIGAGSHAWHFDSQQRWHQRLYRDDRVDVWLITWMPTQGTQLHDHGGSSGAFTVLDGTLNEASLAGGVHESARTGALQEHSRLAGDTVSFGPHYVHDVRNTSDQPSVSVHAYSPPLASMTFYDLPDSGGLVRIAELDTDDPEATLADTGLDAVTLSAAALDPSDLHDLPEPSALPPVPNTVARRRFSSVDGLLADARSPLSRIEPLEAASAISNGAGLVDIRPGWQRRAEGEIPGSLIVERNHLEWRLHPESGARLRAAAPGRQWIVVCSEGYTSSLAADALNSIGIGATDIIGGFHAWSDAGLPTRRGETAVEEVVPAQGCDHSADRGARAVASIHR
jgi:rhodanese-related sulfurtransferase